jgi:hypothetical protein
MKELIRHILREETQAQKKLVSIINKVGFETAIDAVGGIDRFLTVMDGYDYLTPSNIEKLIQYELDKIREESEDWGLGEMDELEEIQSINKFEITNFVNVIKPKVYLTFYVESDREDYDNVRAEIQWRIKEEFGINMELYIDDIINTSTFGPGIDW